MREYKLNPCRLCGKVGGFVNSPTSSNAFWIGCYFYPLTCFNTGPVCETQERAVHEWNKYNKPAILGFGGEHRFLSNFAHAPFKFTDGLEWPSVEHAYQAYKSKDVHNIPTVYREVVGMSSGQVKRWGQLVEIREDWDFIKVEVMRGLNWCKYGQNKELKEKLLATKGSYLEETNTWGDTFWGVCDGKGHNHLGKILMKVRDRL